MREVLGGREIEFHDGIKATVTGRDADKLARDTYHAEKGERRTAELAEVEKLISNARYQENGKVIGHNEEKFTMFRYYAVSTRYKGEEETLRFNVGKDKYTGKYRFYAITVIKRKGFRPPCGVPSAQPYLYTSWVRNGNLLHF